MELSEKSVLKYEGEWAEDVVSKQLLELSEEKAGKFIVGATVLC